MSSFSPYTVAMISTELPVPGETRRVPTRFSVPGSYRAAVAGIVIALIVALLATGAGVTTSRYDVHYVVTEYGIADLYGKTIRHRIQSLIDIAHPSFREELERYAVEAKYIAPGTLAVR